MDGIKSPYQKSAISRFARYCSNGGIPIAGVTDVIVEAYLAALIDETLVRKPQLNVQTLCRNWNKIADNGIAPHMPRLIVPRKESRNYAASEDDLSQALLEELNGYFHFLSGDDLIGGLKKPLRPRSIETNRGNIMRYLRALQASDIDIGAIHTLAELVGFKNFTIGMEWFWERFDKKPCAGIGGIAWTIRCIAVKHLECDEQTAEQFDKILTRVQPRKKGLSPKNRASMQQFDDPEAVIRYLRAPDEVWALAQKEGKTKKGSLLAQSAVALDILIFAPMRINNLDNLRVDQHLGWSKKRLRISIPADEVKNTEQLDFLLPETVSAGIADYMKNWRTLYFPRPSPYLFPGRKGGPKDLSALRRQITQVLFKHTGIRLSPHQFRHSAAKILLDQKPGHYEVVRKVLGHKNITTTYEHYAGAESQSALDLYDTVILDVKDSTSANTKPKRTNMAEQAFLDPLNPFGKGGRR
jgi:integrase